MMFKVFAGIILIPIFVYIVFRLAGLGWFYSKLDVIQKFKKL